MSGHSKWHSIRHKKAAVDAKRGKIFNKHAKLIEVAARSGGPDTNINVRLRGAVQAARELGLDEREDSPWRMVLGPDRELSSSPMAYAIGSAPIVRPPTASGFSPASSKARRANAPISA